MAGEPMSPTVARGKSGRAYRYYVSTSLQRGRGKRADDDVQRLPARQLEAMLTRAITRWAPRHDDPLALVDRAALTSRGIDLTLAGDHAASICAQAAEGTAVIRAGRSMTIVSLPVAWPLRGGATLVVAGKARPARVDPVLVEALRKAYRMLSADGTRRATLEAAPTSPYERRLLRLAFLAPEIQRDILAGRQPARFNLEVLMKSEIPLTWSEQRAALGWAS